MESRRSGAAGEGCRVTSRRRVLAAAAGTGAAALLAGCGLGPAGSTGSASRSANTVTLEYVDVSGDRSADTFAPVISALNERYDRQIELSFSSIPYGNMKRQLLTRLGGNNPPDIAAVDQIWLGSFIDSGRLMTLTDVTDHVDFDDYLPAFRKPLRESGHVYGVPVTTDVRGLYWNKRTFEDAGLDPETPPRTHAELVDVAAQLHEPPDRFGAVYFVVGGRWTVSLFGAGGHVLDDTGTKPRFQEPPGVKAATFLDDLYNTHEVTPPEPPYQNGAQVAREFLNGQYAMTVVEGSWLDYFWQNLGHARKEMPGRFGFAPTPTPDGSPATMSGGFTWVGFKASDHPDVVQDFLRIAAGREFKRHLAIETGAIPTRKSLLDDNEIWEPILYRDTVRELLEMTRTRPIRNWSVVAEALDPALQRVAFDRADPEASLNEAAQAVRASLSGS